MQSELYAAIKARLLTITELKTVGLWNNQFEREKVNVSFGFPCAFIEFTNIAYEDLMNGVQKYNMTVRIHLGFKSFATEDLTILTLKQTVNAKLHTYSAASTTYETRILRRGEDQNFDHDDIQDYMIDYSVSGKDYSVNTLPQTNATVTTLTTINSPVIDNHVIMTASIDSI